MSAPEQATAAVTGPTIRTDIERPSPATLLRAAKLPAATVHEAGGRIGVLPSVIKPVGRAMRVCGPAVTVHSPGGDNLWLHRAIYVAQPGDVLVVHVSGVPDYGYWGEIMATAARERQLGGLVLDGCVRDAALLEDMGFPVFSAGLCIRGTGKDHGARGWINHPVRMGDLTISAGDLIVGDRDGVVAVPLAQVDEVVAASEAREAKEALVLKRLVAGERTLEVYNF